VTDKQSFLLYRAFWRGFFVERSVFVESRIAVVSIIIEDTSVSPAVNALLHDFADYIVGRMGLPYRDRGISIISVVLDAPGDVTSALSGKLGMLKGVSTKTIVAKQHHKKEG
jgi:putative iron-only hydrogenase system regulator